MIDPVDQWSILIDVTNACGRACSNCTRLIGHGKTFHMSVNQFRQAVLALRDFPLARSSDLRLLGIIGGEPLLHPEFDGLCRALESCGPPREHRGLWTSLDWHKSKYASTIYRVFNPKGIHTNSHGEDHANLHTPVLVSSRSVVPDEVKRAALIDNCWLQKRWCSTITPKGYFFCEVAGAMDWVFNGPGGMPVEPGCWNHPIGFYHEQVDRWCNRCGVCLNLVGRRDVEETDDVSGDNLCDLAILGSPRIENGQFVLGEPSGKAESPWRYRA